MPNSFAASADMICPECQQPFTADLWLIVDAQERPDLSGRAYSGTLHNLPCPHCDHVEPLDAPLLVFQPTQTPPVIFFPANNASAQQNQKHVENLLGLLRRQVGTAWEKRWVAESNILHWNSPAMSHDASANEHMLLPIIERLINADSWDKSRRIVESHPELLNDVADALFTRLIASQQDEDARRVLKVYHALLRRCRIVGIEQAFIERTRANRRATSGSTISAELIEILDKLDRPENRANMLRRTQLCEWALTILERSGEPQLWASLQAELGNSLMQNSSSERSENIERAITAYEQALQVRERQTMPVQWARTTANLANAYADRIRGERAVNIERAIHLNEQILEVMTRPSMPIEWAQATTNLANAYRNRIYGAPEDNLEQAINLYKQALQVMERQTMPVEWAQTTNNLAGAYRNHIRGEHAQNLETAINLYNSVLEVRTREAMPVEWAETTNNLALAYADRILGDRAQNLERAIDLYEQVLQVALRKTMPIQWAQTICNLAIAHADRIHGDRAENLERAIDLYEQALQVLTREAMPALWAMTTMNLALAYTKRIRGVRAENLEHAIHLYEQALEIRTREAMPVEWAMTTMNLANAYADRIRGERAKNLEHAIDLYQQALEIRTLKAMPIEWATTTMNLAHAYVDRMNGERAENLEHAIGLYQQALEVRKRESMPVEWADTTVKLAGAYNDRIRGERVENLERAIDLYEQALQVRTREAMPVEWAQTANDLANAYADRRRGVRWKNLERAIELYKQVRQVRKRKAMPVEWAMTIMNLALTYADRIQGKRSKNLERAIVLYQQALRVRTRETMPVEWAQTANNLANAYVDRICGERDGNLECAIAMYEQVLQVQAKQGMRVEWAQTTMNLANAYCARIQGDRAENRERAIQLIKQALEVYTQDAFPNDYRYVQRRLGDLYLDMERWSAAAEAFEQALNTSDLLYAVAATPEARQAELWGVRGISAAHAYTLIKANVATLDTGRDAVLVLEQNRARWLNESLALNVQKSAVVPDATWQSFVEVRTQVQQLQAQSRLPDNTPAKPDYLTLSAALTDALKRLTETVDHIRLFDANFMPQPTFAQVQAAARWAPLVYLLTTKAGAMALIVQTDKVTPVWLNDFTETDLNHLLLKRDGEDVTGGYLLGEFGDIQALQTSLDEMLPVIGERVMAPLAVVLRNLSPSSSEKIRAVTLVPTGLLGLLPLHAAEYKVNDQAVCFLDEFAVTYAPSAWVLAFAQQRSVMAQQRLLALGNPTSTTTKPAWFTDWLAKEVSQRLQTKPPLIHAQASRQAFRDALAKAVPQHLLLGCHGTFDLVEPLRSGLALADGQLTITDLLNELRLDGCDLVTLCACQTAITDFNNVPDEAIGLPAALLQAGARRVVGTLWSVHALPTVLLLRHFYVQVANGVEPVYALRTSLQWLRALPQAEAQTAWQALRSYLPWDQPLLHFDIERLLSSSRPFESPIYWAAFTYTGAI